MSRFTRISTSSPRRIASRSSVSTAPSLGGSAIPSRSAHARNAGPVQGVLRSAA